TQGVVDGSLSLGDLVMVNAFMLQLFIPLGALGVMYRQLKYTLADMDMLFHLLETPPEINDLPDAPALQIQQGEIRFEQVDFGYTPERPILQNVSFTIPAGKKLAVVGHSGAGKSTLSRLLYRFYEVTSGRILIDGQDIRSVTQHSLRKAIGIVPQDTVLFNDSIRYNLQYGNPQATQAELERAAEMAQIRQFIESLPEGWNTVVGERGLKLSGGEKQRVAIARAILKQPPILIFDEATSSLDSATEQAIQKTLNAVAGQHTTLMIAHRLSTIVDADQILVMNQGQVVEQGTHSELLQYEGIYKQMWELQLLEKDENLA
ncbi:MAG: ABC transporter ATP-binding protein/permease, partial [Thiothrix sp.]